MNFLGELFWWTFWVNFFDELFGELFRWTFLVNLYSEFNWWTFWVNFLVNFFDELFGELFSPYRVLFCFPPSVGALQTRTTEGNVRRIVRRGELVCSVLQTCLGELCTRAAATQGSAQWFQTKNLPSMFNLIYTWILLEKLISMNWIFSYTGSKNPVWNRLKIQFVELDFSKLIFHKSSTDQQEVNAIAIAYRC